MIPLIKLVITGIAAFGGIALFMALRRQQLQNNPHNARNKNDQYFS